ncbi:MAG TPA: metallophosphoesterase [Bacteroidales bacterium]|nr:metallophosphoesterase [Bacteroidales bacterium]HSA44330.1 metallophosphoesterase [Bacteroidales bacterium]
MIAYSNNFKKENDHSQIEAPRVFLIGDHHFGHKGIIEMCRRPFANLGRMNRFMIRRWNETVCEDDLVYYLGDMAYGRKAGAASTWKKKLNGQIIHITGNHDKPGDGVPYLFVTWKDLEFLLIHDPNRQNLPLGWDGWIIHGHKHNNDLANYPFINCKNKTVNVSAEVIDFKPVSFEQVYAIIQMELSSFLR